MPAIQNRLKPALVMVLLGFAGASVVGLVFYGADIFRPTRPAFLFPVMGLAGAVTAALLVYGRRREAFLALLLFIVLDATLFLPGTIRKIIPHAAYFLATGAAVYLYVTVYCHRLNEVLLGKTLMMGALLAAMFLAAAAALGLIYDTEAFQARLFWQVSQGILIGLGLGAGLEAAHAILIGRPR